jgi:hypothetical protein
MLAEDHADRWQLCNLMATEASTWPALIITKPLPTAAARIRIVIDDLIHLILRLELPPGATMPRLPASLPPLAF